MARLNASEGSVDGPDGFEVIARTRDRRLRFGPLASPNLVDRCTVELVGPVSGAAPISGEGLAQEVAEFFARLARDWRGWDGELELRGSNPAGWGMVQTALTVRAANDRRGHIALVVAIGQGGAWGIPDGSHLDEGAWHVAAGLTVEVAALNQIAADARRWCLAPR